MRIHCQKSHEITSQEMYDLLIRNGEPRPTCKCGCGKETNWKGVGLGYQDFMLGHHLRVMQNPHIYRTKDGLKEAGRKRREMYKTGEMVAWVQGKTKGTDKRLAEYGKKGSETKLANLEQRVQTSERMKKNRLNGTIPTLRGDKHSQWKGGISSLNHSCHSNRRLYFGWKFPILKRDNFRCTKCNATQNLNVHHNEETFSSILRMFVEQFNWIGTIATNGLKSNEKQLEVKNKIIEAVTSYHIDKSISGITLCESCHKNEHLRNPDSD